MPTEAYPEGLSINDGAEDSPSELTAGDVLLQERLRLGLSEEQVADKLHITMHYVKALESNNYEKLPGAVFAKGYIKSYAMLLGLEADDLLSRYDEFNTQQQAVIAEASRLKSRRKKDRNKLFVIMSLLVFIGGFIGLWLANSYFSEDTISETANSAGTETNSANSLRSAVGQEIQQTTTQAELTLRTESEKIAEPSIQLPDNSAAAIGAAETFTSPLSTPVSPSTLSEPLPDSGNGLATALAAVLQSNNATEPALIENIEFENPAVEADAPRLIEIETAGSDILRISFSGESWVEVNGSESQQIYRGLREVGDILQITGSAPFNVLLGDAPFISMSLNGNEIDLSANIRIDNSVRLTVGL